MEFLNCCKATFDWDANDINNIEGLEEHESSKTDALTAEIPGLPIEIEYTDSDVIDSPPAPLQATLAAATLNNVNLVTTPETDKIAGMDHLDHPHQHNHAMITANDASYEEDKDNGDEILEGWGDNEIQFIDDPPGDILYPPSLF